MFGVSLLSIIVALGFEWAAHRIKPPPRKEATAAGGGKVPGLVIFQHWAKTGLLLVSGVCWAVAFWPIVGQLNWTWLVVGGSFAFFALLIGSILECIKDKKPDWPSFISARILPTLLIITVVNFAVLTTTIGDQFSTYQSNFSTPAVHATTHAPVKHK